MRKFRFALVAAMATLAVAAFTVPASASTHSYSSTVSMTAASTQVHAVQYHLTTKDGTLTYGWRPLANPAAPDSASGCNQDVCIQIVGSSNKVNEWNSQAYWDGGYICTFSAFHQNGTVIRTGTVVCGDAGVFYTFWSPNKYFPSPTLACNTWYGVPGYPCETITK